MSEQLLGIREVQEGGKRLANWYLGHGYILLDVQSGARARQFASQSVSGQQWYVYRHPVYVLGRPEGVAPAGPPELTPGIQPRA